MKKYLLFDNDGVLVETEQWYYEANKKSLNEIDVELPFDVYMEIMARGGTAWEVAKKHGHTQKTVDEQRRRRDIYYREFISSEHIEIDGVVDVLEELSKEYSFGIVTTSRRVDFDLIHSQREIVKYMDFTLCVEEYPRAKPHADPYLAGMKKFNALKDECLVIEDSQRGLSSAVNAGIDCAVVENTFTASHDFSSATYKIKTLRELPTLLKSLKR
ncbi:HAD family phosphatase [Candidatus Sulfurimonas marisnigri]|uniref:phosphoglycolate phosphatase n=1 Tax=Candidatus Sulfurimonas marisnigri TaxID=2740405 RepID=A0A7S7M1P4_9BACT|nr:HAD family phosphatase [Candidatus Sulfurimonas marisnigri]QOY55471.1 HAD family phosphatase [Candidatus Sulfurimonas marisnigri]